MKLKIAVIALVLVAAACGGDDADTAETTGAPAAETTTTATPTTAAPEVTETATPMMTVALAESGLGEVVVDGDGNTLYLFVPDGRGASVCNGDCANAWPPLIGDVVAGAGLDASLLGSAARDDGSEQVTLNGWPLYYFAGDAAVGDTNGQGVNDVWYVLDSAGDAIN